MVHSEYYEGIIERDIISKEYVTAGGRNDHNFSKPWWVLAGLSHKSCTRAPTYTDGSARPQCRGILHFLTFVTISTVALPTLLVNIFRGNLKRRWWKLVFFFLGKACQYGCSMYYHIFPHTNLQDLWKANKNDLYTIPLSGFSNSILIHASFREFVIVGAIYMFLIIAIGIVIHLAFEYPKHPWGSLKLRFLLSTLQFLVMFMHNGVYAGLRDLWLLAYVSYLVGFGAFYSSRAATLPWHIPGIYGTHEDFHVFLFIADFTIMLRGVLFLENPKIMDDPSAHFVKWSR